MVKYRGKILIIILVLVFLIPFIVDANNGGSAQGGNAGDMGNACPSCTWRHWRQAMRFSLYKYDGTRLSYYESVDYCLKDNDCDTFYSYYNDDGVGKSAYQNLENYSASNNWKVGQLTKIQDNSDFSGDIFNGYEGSGLSSEVERFLKFNDTDQNILNRINSIFSQNLTMSDLGQVYINVEPALIIRNESTGTYYYGTAYELNSYFLGGDLGGESGINAQVYYDLGNTFRAAFIQGNRDGYNFIGNIVNLVPTSNLSPRKETWGNSTARVKNASKITSQDGYGIVVYWMGNYADTISCTISESSDKRTYTMSIQNTGTDTIYYDINSNANLLRHNVKNSTYSASHSAQSIVGKVYNSMGETVATCNMTRSIPTCSQTCSGKTGDNLLGCAESYCQDMSDDSSSKRTCIKECGYTSEPSFSSCGTNSKINGEDTVCDQETTASNETCTKATTSNYFKTKCTDRSTIKYGTSLPVIVNPGLGFSYTPTVSGEKTCEMVFEVEKWKFDYAASYTQEERNKLLGILNQYNNVSDTSIWVQDVKDIYKYKSNDANIEIKITNNNDSSVANRTTTKNLVVDKTKNLLVKEVKVSSAGTVTIPLFANGIKTTQTIFGLVKTNSSNETTYKLPYVCINGRNGTLYDLGPSGRCDSTNDGPYSKYFTDLKIKSGTYDTETTVSKAASNLSVNNTCNYTVSSNNKSVSCSIAIIDCEDNEPTKAELRIENKNNLNISYGLSSSNYTLNGTKELNVTSSMENLYGSIGINGSIVATCSKDLNVPTCGSKEGNCKRDYKPSEHDKISKYCSSHWMDDEAKYSSENDCYNSCSSDGENKYSCKRDYKPSEYDKISKYCSSHWMDDEASYSSEKDCYNTCSSGSNTCKNNPEVDTSNHLSVEAFCSIKKNRDDNGYDKANYGNPTLNEQHNIAMCINDCYTPDPEPEPPESESKPEPPEPGEKIPCLGIACNYLYRPISLKDPFPNNRDAGYNWYGKEIFITDDLMNPVLNSSAEAEYVIKLTPDRIDVINKNTDEYNNGKNKNAYLDYVYYDEDQQEGKYVSKFIHSNDENSGGFGLYFSKVKN